MANNRHHKIQTSLGEKISNAILYVTLALLALITLYPFWNVFVLALNEPLDTLRGGVYVWPRSFTLFLAVGKNN